MSAQLLKLQSVPDLVDQVYQALLDAISDGTLEPGARVTQEDLAERFAVSRQPVLQALRMLKKDGLVLDAPGRGLLVAPLDAGWIGHVYEVRGALDVLAVRLAARRRIVIDSRLIERGRKAARGRSIKLMIDLDIAFHNAVYAASGNPLIEHSASLHWVHLKRVMGAVLQSSPQREAIWDEHQAIANAIAAGNEELAASLVELHGRQASETLLGRLTDVLATMTKATP